MNSDYTLAAHRRAMTEGLRRAGARRLHVFREPKDANGVGTGECEMIGCVFGLFYERGQTADLVIDIPGVIARRDAKRVICAAGCGCADEVKTGDLIEDAGGTRFEVVDATGEMGILFDFVIRPSTRPGRVAGYATAIDEQSHAASRPYGLPREEQ